MLTYAAAEGLLASLAAVEAAEGEAAVGGPGATRAVADAGGAAAAVKADAARECDRETAGGWSI